MPLTSGLPPVVENWREFASPAFITIPTYSHYFFAVVASSLFAIGIEPHMSTTRRDYAIQVRARRDKTGHWEVSAPIALIQAE
jgi:hypothetical protein